MCKRFILLVRGDKNGVNYAPNIKLVKAHLLFIVKNTVTVILLMNEKSMRNIITFKA